MIGSPEVIEMEMNKQTNNGKRKIKNFVRLPHTLEQYRVADVHVKFILKKTHSRYRVVIFRRVITSAANNLSAQLSHAAHVP